MKIEQMKWGELSELAQTLIKMRQQEKIPASRRREEIRAKCVEEKSQINLSAIRTQIGWIGVAYSDRGIVALRLPRTLRSESLASLQHEFSDALIIDHAPDKIAREMIEYAKGQRRKFDLKLDWSSLTPFQRAVLQAANTIPFGETRTYGWVAKQIGKPQASRAVGRALATNPIPIILPCHRVLDREWRLAWLCRWICPLKAKLLKLEGALLSL